MDAIGEGTPQNRLHHLLHPRRNANSRTFLRENDPNPANWIDVSRSCRKRRTVKRCLVETAKCFQSLKGQGPSTIKMYTYIHTYYTIVSVSDFDFIFVPSKKVSPKNVPKNHESQTFFSIRKVSFNQVTAVLLFGLSHRSCRLVPARRLKPKVWISSSRRSAPPATRCALTWSVTGVVKPRSRYDGRCSMHAMLKSWCVDMTCSAVFVLLGGYEYIYIYI